MRLAFILLSPRKDGVSEHLLQDVRNRLSPDAQAADLYYCSMQSDRIPDLSSYDRIILSAPVYVKALPAQGLSFLLEAEKRVRQKGNPQVYFLSNCGFLEEENNSVNIAIIRNWCDRCGFHYAYSVAFGYGPRLYPFVGENGKDGSKNRLWTFFVSLCRRFASYGGVLSHKKRYHIVMEQLARDIERGKSVPDVFLRPGFPKTVFLNNSITNLMFVIKLISGRRTRPEKESDV